MIKSAKGLAAVAILTCAFASQGLADTWKYAVLKYTHNGAKAEVTWSCTDESVAIPKDTKAGDALNTMGRAGWELVSVIQDNDPRIAVHFYYFKQPAK